MPREEIDGRRASVDVIPNERRDGLRVQNLGRGDRQRSVGVLAAVDTKSPQRQFPVCVLAGVANSRPVENTARLAAFYFHRRRIGHSVISNQGAVSRIIQSIHAESARAVYQDRSGFPSLLSRVRQHSPCVVRKQFQNRRSVHCCIRSLLHGDFAKLNAFGEKE